jgi:hypothetical protein
MYLRRYRPIALLLLGLHLGACSRWEPTTVSPREVIEEQEPSAVRLTRTDGTRVEMKEPVIRSDSMQSEECQRIQRPWRVECEAAGPIALGDIQSLDVRHTDAVASVAAIAVGALAFYAMMLARAGLSYPGS